MSKVSFHINSITNPVNGGEKQDTTGKKGFFAGNTQFGAKNDPLVEQKKKLAGKQAMKIVTDAFARDRKVSDSLEETRARKAAAAQEYNDNKKEIRYLEDEKALLQKQYGIDPDSQEQKDLELIQKYQSARNGAKYTGFSDEEKARLKELEGTARTEYQSRVLELSDKQDSYEQKNNRLEEEMKSLNASIEDMKIGQNKSQNMLKAEKAAEGIMEAAGKEAIGMLISDAKEAVDEKAEEARKKGEKLAEEREKLEERREEAKERREEEQAIIENAGKTKLAKTDLDVQTSDHTAMVKARQEIQKILRDNNLLDEDIKGLKIDFGH